MEGRVRLITDSVADIPPAYVRQFNIEVLPIYLTLGDQTYREDSTLDREWFYQALARRDGAFTTAAPAPQEFSRAYASLAAEGAEEIIGIFTASSVSSIYDHARVAAREFRDARIHLIDSRQVSMGTGWLAIRAGELLEDAMPVPEVMRTLTGMRDRISVLGVLNSLEHLRRSGRIGWATQRVAHFLRIKPLIAFECGTAQLVTRVRTYWRAIDRLIELVEERQPFAHLALLHSRARDEVVDRLRDALAGYCQETELPVIDVGAVFATHIGPGGLGVALVQAER